MLKYSIYGVLCILSAFTVSYVLFCALFYEMLYDRYVQKYERSRTDNQIPFDYEGWRSTDARRNYGKNVIVNHLMTQDLMKNHLEKWRSKEMIEKNLGEPREILSQDIYSGFHEWAKRASYPDNLEELWFYDIMTPKIQSSSQTFRVGFDKDGNYCFSTIVIK